MRTGLADRRVQPLVAALVAACAACRDPSFVSYAWDDRQLVCSQPYDDRRERAEWAFIEDELELARDAGHVALFHAHEPGVTVSMEAIERMLDSVDEHHLDYFTYRELVPGPRRPGVALAFDDNYPEAWLGIRDLLAQHGAHVTFFVSRYRMLTDAQRAMLDELAADGHDIEPHSVHHVHGHRYMRAHGVDGLLEDEIEPSFAALAGHGYVPTAYAYPFGEHSAALDDAILATGIGKVRTSPGECPY